MDVCKTLNKVVTLTFHLCDKTLFFSDKWLHFKRTHTHTLFLLKLTLTGKILSHQGKMSRKAWLSSSYNNNAQFKEGFLISCHRICKKAHPLLRKEKKTSKQTTQKQISSTLEADGRTIRVAIIKLFGNKRLKKGLRYLWVNYNKRNLKPTLSSPLTQEKHIRNTKTYLRRDYSRIYYCSIIYG